MLKTLSNGYKMGCRRPSRPLSRLRLSDYLRLASIPTPPATVSYSKLAIKALSQVYMNATLGCCVDSGGGHAIGVYTGNADNGNPIIFTNSQIISQYSTDGGYVPGDENTDNGVDPVTALNNWKSVGFQGSKILGWASIDGSNMYLVRAALYLFEVVMFAAALPDAWINPFPSTNGFTWGLSGPPDPDNGHFFVGIGYDTTGNVMIDTWGLLGMITPAATGYYTAQASGGALYVAFSEQSIVKATQKAPNGFDSAQLLSDLSLI
jgi:hypothetical protein